MNFWSQLSLLGAFLTASGGGFIAVREALNPNTQVKVAGEVIITKSTGQLVICENLGTWKPHPKDAIIIHGVSAHDSFNKCADYIEEHQGINMLAARPKYWLVTDGDSYKDTIPSGAQPYMKNEDGEDVPAVYELGNKLHAYTAAAVKLRSMAKSAAFADKKLQLPEQSKVEDSKPINVTDLIMGAVSYVL